MQEGYKFNNCDNICVETRLELEKLTLQMMHFFLF